MSNYIDYDMHGYHHAQLWRLVRELTAFGWTITIRAVEQRRHPKDPPVSPRGYECWATNPGYDIICRCPIHYGKTPWDALKKAVEETINPTEKFGYCKVEPVKECGSCGWKVGPHRTDERCPMHAHPDRSCDGVLVSLSGIEPKPNG